MDIVIYKRVHFILLGAATLLAATSVAAASSVRRLSATCGLVLLSQVLTRPFCITIAAMSTRPAAVTVRSDIQSAVSPSIFTTVS